MVPTVRTVSQPHVHIASGATDISRTLNDRNVPPRYKVACWLRKAFQEMLKAPICRCVYTPSCHSPDFSSIEEHIFVCGSAETIFCSVLSQVVLPMKYVIRMRDNTIQYFTYET